MEGGATIEVETGDSLMEKGIVQGEARAPAQKVPFRTKKVKELPWGHRYLDDNTVPAGSDKSNTELVRAYSREMVIIPLLSQVLLNCVIPDLDDSVEMFMVEGSKQSYGKLTLHDSVYTNSSNIKLLVANESSLPVRIQRQEFEKPDLTG